MILTADLRMVRHSGIGRYLRNLLPLLIPQLHADEIHILASSSVLAGFEGAGLQPRHNRSTLTPALAAEGPNAWLADPRIRLIETSAPIYSLAEQRLLTSVPNNHLLWVPHFNAPLYRRGPLAVTIHDIAPLALPQILNNALKRAYAKLLITRAVSQADAILCVSDFTRTELTTRLHVPAEKLTVTHPGLDTDWPHTAPPHIEPDSTPYLLFVGNVKPNKNLSLLLRAFAEVQHRIPHRLILAGKLHGFGTNDEAVLRQAQSFGDRIRFAGEVHDPVLQHLYAGASALVLPSLYEGFGLPLLEAMSLGCPVLASTAGSLPEIAGNAALYFNPHSPEELAARLLQLNDTALMDNLRTLGRARVQHFSFQTCAHQTATILNQHLIPNP
jgi:glycosyltransferase involved in cell wall biosynthesis